MTQAHSVAPVAHNIVFGLPFLEFAPSILDHFGMSHVDPAIILDWLYPFGGSGCRTSHNREPMASMIAIAISRLVAAYPFPKDATIETISQFY